MISFIFLPLDSLPDVYQGTTGFNQTQLTVLNYGDDKIHQKVRVVSIKDEFQNPIAQIIKLANMVYQITMCCSLTSGGPTISSIKHLGPGVEGTSALYVS